MALPAKRSRIGWSALEQGMIMVRCWPWRLLGALGSIVLLFSLALIGYQASARPVTLVVDGTILPMRTHHRLVQEVLQQANLSLGPQDQVSPPIDHPWEPTGTIVVRRAFPIIVRADGYERRLYGQPQSLLEIMVRAQVTLLPHDLVYANRQLVPESAYADEAALQTLLSQQAGSGHLAAPPPRPHALQVEVVRAIPLFIFERGLEIEIRSTSDTLGAALEEAGFRIYRADQVYPPLDTPVTAGLHAYITRATPVQIAVDGHVYTTRTHTETVSGLLQEEGISLDPRDRVEPPLETPLQAGMSIRIIRVTTLDLVEEVAIPYRRLQTADPSQELDQYRLQPGEDGLRELLTQITYADGQEIAREFMGERIVQEPLDQIFYYGTRIVVRTMETPDGTIEYWRKFRVLATSYYPSTCDKTPDDPLYGITYTGKWATRGIIAVDPRVIPFHTRMYVPGYGFGAAEDIGGAIKGRHIDLCFDDADWGKGLWSTRYVDVYLLTPVPPIGTFPWILP